AIPAQGAVCDAGVVAVGPTRPVVVLAERTERTMTGALGVRVRHGVAGLRSVLAPVTRVPCKSHGWQRKRADAAERGERLSHDGSCRGGCPYRPRHLTRFWSALPSKGSAGAKGLLHATSRRRDPVAEPMHVLRDLALRVRSHVTRLVVDL